MRKVTVALAASALAATLAACSSSGTGHSSTPPAAPGTNAPAPASGTGADAPLEAAQFVQAATAATSKAQTVKFKESMNLLGAAITMNGAARFGDEGVDASVTSDTPIGTIQVVIVQGVVYMKIPGKGKPGRPWVKGDFADQELAPALRQADPRQWLQLLAGVGTLKPAGHDTINGVPSTHYSVTVDLTKVAKKNADLAKLIKQLTDEGVKVQDIQIWVDADKRPVRLVTSIQLPNPRSPANKTTSTQTVDYTGWGAPVTITAPPASQVTVG